MFLLLSSFLRTNGSNFLYPDIGYSNILILKYIYCSMFVFINFQHILKHKTYKSGLFPVPFELRQ